VDQITEIGSGLRFGGIGPELIGEVLARLRRTAVEDEKSEQGLQTRRADSRKRGVADDQTKFSEQVDQELRHCRGAGEMPVKRSPARILPEREAKRSSNIKCLDFQIVGDYIVQCCCVNVATRKTGQYIVRV
jgi:hypothetical protein